MIRLRVGDLDQWVRFVEPSMEQFELSTEEFLAMMRREAPPSDDMLAGSALHSLLEHAKEGDEIGTLEGVERDGFVFRFDGSFTLPLPAEREPEIMEHVFDTPSGKVLLRGRIDGRDIYDEIVDYKLSSTFDAERYAGSLQWRAYLLMTGARRFKYVVFQSKRTERDVWIYDMHELVFWRYPQMEADVHRRVCELAAFVAEHVPELAVDPAETNGRGHATQPLALVASADEGATI